MCFLTRAVFSLALGGSHEIENSHGPSPRGFAFLNVLSTEYHDKGCVFGLALACRERAYVCVGEGYACVCVCVCVCVRVCLYLSVCQSVYFIMDESV